MEYKHAVKLTVWDDGFTADYTGRIHRVDPITHELRIEVKPGEYERIQFGDVIAVKVGYVIEETRNDYDLEGNRA
jgi:hypothetical protein